MFPAHSDLLLVMSYEYNFTILCMIFMFNLQFSLFQRLEVDIN